MAMAIGRKNLDDAGKEIEKLFNNVFSNTGHLFKKTHCSCHDLFKLARITAITDKTEKVTCQQVIHTDT